MRRRAPPAFGCAIHSADLRISSAVSPVMRAASSMVVLFPATALSKSLVEASMNALSIQPFSAM